MVKLNRIYTRTGDDGTTGLADGSRRAKNDPRIEAYGAVDEANSAIGLVRLHAGPDDDAVLARIQNDLFDLGADLATPGEDFTPSAAVLRITAGQVERLEREIDAMNAALAPLRSFVLPGGTPAAAYLHLARTIVRRAERLTVEAGTLEPVNRAAIAYLNRLSDHLFVMSRAINARADGDVLWTPGGNR